MRLAAHIDPRKTDDSDASVWRELSNRSRFTRLLYEALETERGGIAVYPTALRGVQHDALKQE